MCGIIGAFNIQKNNKKVNDWMIDIFEDQKNRGLEGFGFSFLDKKGKVHTKRATEITKIFLDVINNPTSVAIFHHRFPTSSANKISQTHPLLVQNKQFKFDYLVIHNGVISNADKLRKIHESKNITYRTVRKIVTFDTKYDEFNDSESLAIELALFIEKKQTKIKAIGTAAFIIMQINKNTQTLHQFIYGRSSNPLMLQKDNSTIYLSSENENKNAKLIPENELFFINYKTGKTKQIHFELTKNKIITYSRKNPYYPFHEIKEKENKIGYKLNNTTYEDTTYEDTTYEDTTYEDTTYNKALDKFVKKGIKSMKDFLLYISEDIEEGNFISNNTKSYLKNKFDREIIDFVEDINDEFKKLTEIYKKEVLPIF